MVNYSIAEEFTLPSRGLVYPVKVNPVVKLRSMTTEEEMKRLAPSDRAYKNLCEIIDDCLIEDPGISAYDMCVADYQFLLHKLRIVTYGSEYPSMSRCPYCKSDNEEILNLSELTVVNYAEEELAKYLEFELPTSKKKIKLRLQTPRMIDEINLRNKELKKKSKGKATESVFLFTVAALIDTVDGEKMDPVRKEDFVRRMPMMDTNYIVKHAEKLVESFGIKMDVPYTCSLCGLDYTSIFRVTKEFFGPRID